MQQFKGIVKKVVSKAIDIQGKPFIKNEITIDSDGESKTLLKFTKPETTFSPTSGTKVQVTATEQEDKYGNVVYKIDSKPESFLLLNTENKKAGTGETGTKTTTTKATTGSSSYDPNGAKRGNALTNAINLLMHNKGKDPVTSKDATKLLELARMVYTVSTELETPTTNTNKQAEVTDNEEPSHLIKTKIGIAASPFSDLEDLGVPDPRWIVQELDRFVIGQEQAKKTLALMMLNRALVLLDRHKLIQMEYPIQKSNVLMIGPTGTGKTALIQALEEIYGIPILIFDVTSLTATGYAGSDVTSVLNNYIDKLYDFAYKQCYAKAMEEDNTEIYSVEEFIEKSLELGIIYLDEIDKIKGHGGIREEGYGISLQNELLKYLDGAKVSLRKEHGYSPDSANNKMKLTELDTSNIFFITGGAFHGLSDIISDRLYKGSSMGFTGNIDHKAKDKDDSQILQHVTTEDLIRFGMRPEFLGRLPLRAVLNNHTVDTIKDIILKSENSVYLQYKSIFKLFNIDLIIEDAAIEEVAKIMISMKIGARALKSIFNKTFEDEIFNVFQHTNKELVITKEYIKGKFK